MFCSFLPITQIKTNVVHGDTKDFLLFRQSHNLFPHRLNDLAKLLHRAPTVSRLEKLNVYLKKNFKKCSMSKQRNIYKYQRRRCTCCLTPTPTVSQPPWLERQQVRQRDAGMLTNCNSLTFNIIISLFVALQ